MLSGAKFSFTVISLFIAFRGEASGLPQHICDSQDCSSYTNKIVESFESGKALSDERLTTVFHGKCETYNLKSNSPAKTSMGLLLIDNVDGDLHYSTNSASYVPEMEQGWNPYQYTSVRAMQRSSDGFHLEPEQKLFDAGNFSFNKLRVAEPDSYHHIYISKTGEKQVSIIGRKGQNNYYCQMKPNIERTPTPREQGVPISFGEDFCEFSYRCHPKAIKQIKNYHQLSKVNLRHLSSEVVTGTCHINSGRQSSQSFGQKSHVLLKVDKTERGWELSQRMSFGAKENPFVNLSQSERLHSLEGRESLPMQELSSFAISSTQALSLWVRSTEEKHIVLGVWMGKHFTCKLN